MDVGAWLRGLGLARYEQAFRDHDIDAGLLPTLTADELRELGVTSLGHRKRLLAAIADLKRSNDFRTPVPAGQAERRQLTVMFVDLVGSTTLSTRLDPEDMRELLHVYQNTVTGEVARWGGHVAHLMGDGVLAYFGWPRADEDDAECAVRAGLAIALAVGRLPAPTAETLAVRIGIASGLVVVGDLIGEGGSQTEEVVGETPNLAARLQEVAAAGAVVIAEGTRRLLGEVFELQPLEPRALKGFARPVRGFRVVGERPAGSRFEARRAGGLLPMVGRDQELALVLERWRQAAAGEGQAVLLVGEAGIGKSRLVRATLDVVEGEAHTALRYQCSPHHTGTALWPIAQQLGFAAGFAPADTEESKLGKLEALLRQGAEDVATAAALIAPLLGLDASARCPLPELTPRQRRDRTLVFLVQQLLGLARRRPVLMVLEDAHWIDPTTLELVGQALDRIAAARVLMLVTTRPDGQPTLGGHPHVTRLTLNRLGRGPSEALVAHLTGGRGLPAALLGTIAARTDGVPLFVEELTKAVLEAGTAGAAGPVVPASLHASLMARLDRVPGVKEAAQVAACIGREFAYPLLAAVWPAGEAELRAALDRLIAAELVFGRGTPPEASYAFKHALVRDAAHESLLKAQRQQVHARIVGAMEQRFPETATTEPELLAQHCTEAGLVEQAVDYWQRAGQQALARSAMAEAMAQLTKGLEALASLPAGSARLRRELGLQVTLGQASIAAKGFAAPETGRAFARARELCGELGGDLPELFPALYGQSVFHFQRGELAAAYEVACELRRLGEERGDRAGWVTGHRMMGSALCQLGRFAESRDHFEAALALYGPEQDRSSAIVYAIDSRVMCLSWLSHLDAILGHPARALARSRKALAFGRELGHPNTTAVALAWDCIFHQLLRDPWNARAQAEAVMALASEQGFPLYLAAGTVVRGWALAESGRAPEGVATIRQGLAAYAATGAEMWSPYFLGLLGEALGRAGEAASGLNHVADALAHAGRLGARWIVPELHRFRGMLHLALPEPAAPTAEACFREALAVARTQDARLWELRTATDLARLCAGQGRRPQARELLVPLYDRFEKGAGIRDLRDAEVLLDELTSWVSPPPP